MLPPVLRHPKLLALAAGALSATGFAPLGLWPVALAALTLLLWLVREAPDARAAFFRGWSFGVGHFTVGLNWIAHAFSFQDAMPHWLGYVAVVLLSLYLAVFPGTAALAGWLARRSGVALALSFAAAWIVTEWLRATLFTGFAWNPLAVIWTAALPVARASAWIGTLGLSGLTALAAGGLLLALRKRPAALVLVVPLPLLAAANALPHSAPGTGTGKLVRIVQPNTSTTEKYRQGAEVANLRKLVQLSGRPGPRPRLLLWPEAAIDNGLLLQEDAVLREWLSRMLGPGDMLLTGGVALEYDARGNAIGARNSVFALGPDAQIRGRYDKAHLVPYGEYLPMRAILMPLGLSRLVPGDLDFWPGPGPAGFDLPGFGRAGFQICYEIIFSGEVVDGAARPAFLFNPSNDAWFGSWGPPQHLAQARLRAIEEGVPVLRATPTGISAVVAPDGVIRARVPLGQAGVIDAEMPAAAAPTLFGRAGNVLPLLLALGLGALAVVFRRAAH